MSDAPRIASSVVRTAYGVVPGKYVAEEHSGEWYIAEIGLHVPDGVSWAPMTGEKSEHYLKRLVDSGVVAEGRSLQTSAGNGYTDRREADAVAEAMNDALRNGFTPSDLKRGMWGLGRVSHNESGYHYDESLQKISGDNRILGGTFENAARDAVHRLTLKYDDNAVIAKIYKLAESYRNITSKEGFALGYALASEDGREYRGVYRYRFYDPRPPSPGSKFAKSIKELDERHAEAMRELVELSKEDEEPTP